MVGHYIKQFKQDVEKSLGISRASLNLYDTQFYSKEDGSLDFSSTGSCFQLVGPNDYNPKDTVSLLEDPSNHELKNVYKQYEVKNIEVSSEQSSIEQGFFIFENGNPVFLVRDWTVEITFVVCCLLAMFSETSQTGRYVGTVVAVGHCHFHRFRVDDRHLPSVLFIQKVRSKRHLIPREFIFYLCVSVICVCVCVFIDGESYGRNGMTVPIGRELDDIEELLPCNSAVIPIKIKI